MSPKTVLLLELMIVAPLLTSACDKTEPPTTNADDEAKREARQKAAAEEARLAAIEQERSSFVAQADEAKAGLEAEPSLDSLARYSSAIKGYAGLSEEAREGLEIDAYVEVMWAGAGQDFIDNLVIDWANKKARTSDLKAALKSSLWARVELMQLRGSPVGEALDDGATSLSYGGVEDGWKVGGPIWATDSALIKLVQAGAGGETAQTMCRAALDKVIASDKRDTARQHYVMQACADEAADDWEAELGAWVPAKDTKAFRKAYAPIRAQRDAGSDDE